MADSSSVNPDEGPQTNLESADVNVDDILTVNVNYNKLQFLLKNVLQRLQTLEAKVPNDPSAMDGSKAGEAPGADRSRNIESKDGHDGTDAKGTPSASADELAKATDRLNDLEDQMGKLRQDLEAMAMAQRPDASVRGENSNTGDNKADGSPTLSNDVAALADRVGALEADLAKQKDGPSSSSVKAANEGVPAAAAGDVDASRNERSPTSGDAEDAGSPSNRALADDLAALKDRVAAVEAAPRSGAAPRRASETDQKAASGSRGPVGAGGDDGLADRVATLEADVAELRRHPHDTEAANPRAASQGAADPSGSTRSDASKAPGADRKRAPSADAFQKLAAAVEDQGSRLGDAEGELAALKAAQAAAADDAGAASRAAERDRRDMDSLRDSLGPRIEELERGQQRNTDDIQANERGLGDLKGVVEPLQEKTNALRDDVSDLKDSTARQDGRLASQAESIEAMNARVNAADSRIGAAEDALKVLQSQLGALVAAPPPVAGEGDSADAAAASTGGVNPHQVRLLQGTVDAMVGKLADLQKQLDELRAKTDENHGKHNDTEADLSRRLDALGKDVDLLLKAADTARSDMDGMKSQLGATQADATKGAGLKTGVDAMKHDVDGLKRDLETLRASVAAADQNRRASLADSGVASKARDGADAVDIDGINRVLDALRDDARRSTDSNAAALATLREQLAALRDAIDELQRGKADRSELSAGAAQGGAAAGGPSGRRMSNQGVNDAMLDELRRKIVAVDARVSAVADRKPGVTEDSIQPLSDRLGRLEADVRDGRLPRGGGAAGGADAQEASGMAQQALQVADRNTNQMIEVRATVDHIHHTKADATAVAQKADRDYVENALEKLMREVEQVMNSTNAGLIDTLDKSLGILRDMIDGKASKADLARIRAASEEVGSVPEGLTGYKSYRCLGCNRTVDAMRSRPMGSNFSNFMNRLPTSPRSIGQGPPPRSAPSSENGKPSGYLT